jgi:kynureninase
MERLVKKSRKLTRYLFFILDDINKEKQQKVTEVITPKGDNEHGCQVSILMLERGKEVFNELTNQGVICDWREPNVIRIAPVPLYNTYEDVWQFGNIIKNILG